MRELTYQERDQICALIKESMKGADDEVQEPDPDADDLWRHA